MAGKNYKAYPENILELTDSVVVNLWSRQYLGNSLELTDATTGSHKVLVVGDTLVLTDEVTKPEWNFESLTDTIPLSDQATSTHTKRLSVSNQITLTDTVREGIKARTIEDVLTLADTVVVQPTRWLSVSHNLSEPQYSDLTQAQIDTLPPIIDPGYSDALVALLASIAFRDSAEVRGLVRNLAITDYLQLTQEAARLPQVGLLSVENHIHISDSVELVLAHEQIEHVIQISDSVSWWVGRPASNTIELTQTVAAAMVRPRSLSDTILIADSLSEVGATLIVHPIHSLTPSANVTFTYPYAAPTFTLQVRAPNLGNDETMNFRRIKRRDHGGRLEVYRRSIWPKMTRLKLTFTALTEGERFHFFHLLDMSLGRDVGYLDHESRQWRGIFTTPQVKFEEVGPAFNHEVTLEFQGVIA